MHGRIERPVEVVEGFQFAEGSRLDATTDLPFLTDEQLVLQNQFQKFGVAQRVAGRFLQSDIERLRQAGEAQCAERGLQAVIHRSKSPGSRGEQGSTVNWSGETEPGSAEAQPGEGYPDQGG